MLNGHCCGSLEQAEAKLRTYVSSLEHLLAHEDKFREEALVKKGETKKVH